jgi:ribonuclease I
MYDFDATNNVIDKNNFQFRYVRVLTQNHRLSAKKASTRLSSSFSAFVKRVLRLDCKNSINILKINVCLKMLMMGAKIESL